ncbi:hypothetical protein GN958_ATG06897 [Phytophthora infestans]|uniref:Uncharacterized protein n=1 Tax=Phytophthora infestans TaxID=4787 RepID=A0A8S9TN42_PHYIN|nr:hypothetical protein GN958_ATG20469 [Phytophthora infestans]KAF4143913.1 hypothetical protein GN958_ATG06897 [Phytophthora infestans]
MEASLADIVQAVEVLQLSSCSSVGDILNPPGENEIHFAYSDSEVVDIVIGVDGDDSIEDDDEEGQHEILDDAEFAAAMDVVLRKLMDESDSTEALCITRSYLNRSLFEYNKNKLVRKKQQLITSHFKPI